MAKQPLLVDWEIDGAFTLLAFGPATTGMASLLFVVIKPTASYWAFGFPAAVLAAMGAVFTYTVGSMYISKISSSHEQSVSAGVFNSMITVSRAAAELLSLGLMSPPIKLGGAIGMTVSTAIFNYSLSRHGEPLKAHKAAQWAGFALGLLGAWFSTCWSCL